MDLAGFSDGLLSLGRLKTAYGAPWVGCVFGVNRRVLHEGGSQRHDPIGKGGLPNRLSPKPEILQKAVLILK